jgi:hypothetical protein
MGKKAKRKKAAAIGRSVREEPRLRHFPWLGWSIVLVPMDVGGPTLGGVDRTVARMMIGTMYGFEPEELIPLRARRLAIDDEPERTWWVMAIPKAAVERRSRPDGTSRPPLERPKPGPR